MDRSGFDIGWSAVRHAQEYPHIYDCASTRFYQSVSAVRHLVAKMLCPRYSLLYRSTVLIVTDQKPKFVNIQRSPCLRLVSAAAFRIVFGDMLKTASLLDETIVVAHSAAIETGIHHFVPRS